MSHDDILASDCIEKLVKEQEKDSEIDCIIPSLVFFEKDINNPEEKYTANNIKNDFSNHPTVIGERAFDEMLDYTISGFALWRTSLIRRIGMPTESFNSDECMQRVWVKNCKKVAFSDAKFGYRQSNNSIVKGLKPYHYFSVATNLRLFNEMTKVESIRENRKQNMQYKFFEGLFYLNNCYAKGLNEFSQTQKAQLESLFEESYYSLRKNLIFKKTIKGFIMKVVASYRLLYNLVIRIL